MKILLSLLASLSFLATASAQPATTKPGLINMMVTPCAANTLIIGNGATAAPLCGPTMGTGVSTALGVNVGTAGAFTVNGGALGTPSSGTLTNATGLPTTGLTGTLQAAQEPAHTGDCTNSAGSLAFVCLKTNNVAFTASATAANGQLPGTATNDSASAGNVGQFISSTIAAGSAVSLSTTITANITSISLTAGDWDVDAVATTTLGATTATSYIAASVSLVSATLDSSAGRFGSITYTAAGLVLDNSSPPSVNIPPTQFSLSTTTTVFLVMNAKFNTSTMSGYGIIRARRVR